MLVWIPFFSCITLSPFRCAGCRAAVCFLFSFSHSLTDGDAPGPLSFFFSIRREGAPLAGDSHFFFFFFFLVGGGFFFFFSFFFFSFFFLVGGGFFLSGGGGWFFFFFFFGGCGKQRSPPFFVLEHAQRPFFRIRWAGMSFFLSPFFFSFAAV